MVILRFTLVLLLSLQAYASPEVESPVVNQPNRLVSIIGKLLNGARPGMTLSRVMGEILQNSNTGALSTSDRQYLLEQANVSDSGEVARLLADRGYNYLVLHYLRIVLETRSLNIAALRADDVGKEQAGIPVYLAVAESEFEIDAAKNIVIEYSPGIYNMILRLKLLVEESIDETTQSKRSMKDHMMSWVYNQFVVNEENLAWANAVEALLVQYQGLLAAVEVKKVRSQKQRTLNTSKYSELEREVAEEKDVFLQELGNLLRQVELEKGPKWIKLSKVYKNSKHTLEQLKSRFLDTAVSVLKNLDRLDGTTENVSKYAGDTPIELENQRLLDIDLYEELSEKWGETAGFSYFKRNDKWFYQHLHSEEHGPYYEKESYYKTKSVHFTVIPPVNEEEKMVEFLRESFDMNLYHPLKYSQILDVRRTLEHYKAKHAEYMAGGKLHAHDSDENFLARNNVIKEMFERLLSASYRQEAHSRMEYVGMQFSQDLYSKYAKQRKLLEKRSKAIGYTKMGLGVAVGTGAAAACGYFLLLPAM